MVTTLRDFLSILFKRKAVIIITFITLTMTVFIGLELETPAYKARVKMLVFGVKEAKAPYYKGINPGGIGVHESILESNYVLERVVNALQLYKVPLDYEKRLSSRLKAVLIDYRLKKFKRRFEKLTPEKQQALLFRRAINNLKRHIKIEKGRSSEVFYISVFDFSPAGAVTIANVLSRVFVIFDLELQLVEHQLQYGEKHPITRQVKDKIDELQKYLDGRPIPDLEAIGPASVKIIEQARGAVPVIRHNKRQVLNFTALLGAVLGISFAFIFEFQDQRFRSARDVEPSLNIPLLGSIPKRKSKDKLLIKDTSPITDYIRFYQKISDQIYLLMKDRSLKSILITDAEGSRETAAIIANIGSYLSHKAGHKVLIIDANLRNPSIFKIFDISNSMGLADVIEREIPYETAINDLGSNLAVLPAGNTIFNPSTLLGSPRLSDVIKAAKEKYEAVLLACADLKNFTDAVILSPITDGVVLVVNERKVRREVVKNAIAPLKEKKTNLIGVILNNRKFPLPEMIYKRM